MTRQRIVRHFLPHYFVHTSLAEDELVPSITHDRIHHRAHGLALSALFVYLQVLVVLTVGFYVIRFSVPQVLGTASFSAEQIIAITNARREANGLAPLSTNGILSAAAAAKAADMLANDYWAHTSPAGATPWSFMTASGYRYIYAGENLARDFSDAASIVSAWMNSPSHRANLLDKNFQEIGVAVTSGRLNGREGTLVVQMFGAGISQVPQEQPLVQASPVGKVLPQGSLRIVSPLTATGSEPVTVLASNKYSIARGLSFAFVGLIFILFVLEVLVTLGRAHVHLKSGVLAHLMLFGFILVALWYLQEGAVI